ncbi:hypothetical protein [Brachybacterium fresconis]|uniref:Uncharacterized protein n=1 Tax=Brachybacterium fresconis TaxID=173363 RepID=A0ABS4YPE0_9MICO|nr:hypothetical protein [Brachybacterium fresconis]MBP2410665.1 hypothetical protein [Brachybacterium fresconis]
MSTRAADSHATASVSDTGREIGTDRPVVIVPLIGVFVLAIAVGAARRSGD